MPDLKIVEWRGVRGLVAAEVLTDDNGSDGYTTGTPFAVAGVAEISKTRDSSSEAHYYDNIPAVVVTSEGADTVNISASAIPIDVLAKLTGQYYDSTLGMLVEGARQNKMYALGYITKNTAGDDTYVWRLRGSFAVPDQTNATENNGTDANGQTLVYTGVSTIHKFTKNNAPAMAVVVDTGLNLANVSTFFDTVTTPDTLTAKN